MSFNKNMEIKASLMTPAMAYIPGLATIEKFSIGGIPWNECEGKAVKLVDAHLQFPQAALKYERGK